VKTFCGDVNAVEVVKRFVAGVAGFEFNSPSVLYNHLF